MNELTDIQSSPKMSVLLEMRPALDGFAGIPQETRLLFRGLSRMDTLHVEGLLQTSLKFLSAGTSHVREDGIGQSTLPESTRLSCYARVVVSVDAKSPKGRVAMARLYLKRRRVAWGLALSSVLPGVRKIKTTLFESRYFEDFIWQSFFEKTLPSSDYALVTSKNYRVCTVPWNMLQTAGLFTLKLGAKLVYPRLDTEGVDVFITQTPYPARLDPHTTLVVRYHDALPIFMPHAFANQSRHLATHFQALKSNVESGAYFACISESTRQDLLRVFPEVADRAVTIHNAVSHHYFNEESAADLVPQIVRSRLNFSAPQAVPAFRSLAEQDTFYSQHLEGESFTYLLMVSTIEPRKNHRRLIAAWERIHAGCDASLKLVIVGNLGWDVDPIMREMRTWIDQGGVFLLNNVPADDLRVLYRHAAATVCPSLAEGFDFSGVEAMRCGGVVLASDIPVHREVYQDAAHYFEPHSTDSLVEVISDALYSSQSADSKQVLKERGDIVSSAYLPEKIFLQWADFLDKLRRTEEPS